MKWGPVASSAPPGGEKPLWKLLCDQTLGSPGPGALQPALCPSVGVSWHHHRKFHLLPLHPVQRPRPMVCQSWSCGESCSWDCTLCRRGQQSRSPGLRGERPVFVPSSSPIVPLSVLPQKCSWQGCRRLAAAAGPWVERRGPGPLAQLAGKPSSSAPSPASCPAELEVPRGPGPCPQARAGGASRSPSWSLASCDRKA